MAHITRTINPLHFEDLDPRRFEDLARQLIYDFKNWSALEATGTLGNDQGFDVRGREIIYDYDDIEDDEIQKPAYHEKLWLIQCKREKTISPRKLTKYLEDILKNNDENIYGIIFIAACNFSKKARDIFIAKVREFGINEFQLWGRAELEDLLFQPKNDHLLFAYFGISLQVRKRSLRTMLRSRIANKKKAIRILENSMMGQVLLRDANDNFYPYSGEIPNFHDRPAWKIYSYEGHKYHGLEFLVGRFMAYLDDDKLRFDYVRDLNDARHFYDPWQRPKNTRIDDKTIREFWRNLPEENRAHLTVTGIVEYDNILAIDEDGDDIFNGPHLYIPFRDGLGPFSFFHESLATYEENSQNIYPDFRNRIKYFSKKLNKKEKTQTG